MGSSCPCFDCPIRNDCIFSSIREEDFFKTKDLVHQLACKRHQIVLHEDNPCLGFYILRSGMVKLVKSSRTGRQQILKLVGPAGVIGEDAVFETGPYAYTAEAMEESEACFVNKEDFFRLMNGRPGIAMKMMSILSSELRATRAQMIDIALKDARERMAGLIIALADKFGKSKNEGMLLSLSLTRSELAEMIGISQETAIRLLSDFKCNGLIKTCRREITVLDEDGIRMIAGGDPGQSDKIR